MLFGVKGAIPFTPNFYAVPCTKVWCKSAGIKPLDATKQAPCKMLVKSILNFLKILKRRINWKKQVYDDDDGTSSFEHLFAVNLRNGC